MNPGAKRIPDKKPLGEPGKLGFLNTRRRIAELLEKKAAESESQMPPDSNEEKGQGGKREGEISRLKKRALR